MLIYILYIDEKIIDQLLSPDVLRFWRTGAELHCIQPEEEDDFDVAAGVKKKEFR